MTRRVVVTGMGTVNPLSSDVREYWRLLCQGKSGVGLIEQMDTTDFKVKFGGEVKNFNPSPPLDAKVAKRIDRYAQFAMIAAINAVEQSGLDLKKEDPFRCGVILGTGIGGMNEYEEQHTRFVHGGPGRISPFCIPKMMPNAAPGNISIHFGMMGVNASVGTACASAGNAVHDALRVIQHDQADVVITGGTESTITAMGLGGFISARALSNRNDDPQAASRPFDRDRDGFVLSEGAGLLILEEYEHAKKRGADIWCEVLGVGCTADAHHITAPHPEGEGASHAMKFAMRDAKLNPEDIDYVNAHGTSTELGDIAETNSVKRVFGDHAKKLAVNSTKSLVGHLLGASGGVELIACACSIRHGVLHPTINLDNPDPKCDLDYVPNTARETRIRTAMCNSFGFGGHNCSIILGAV